MSDHSSKIFSFLLRTVYKSLGNDGVSVKSASALHAVKWCMCMWKESFVDVDVDVDVDSNGGRIKGNNVPFQPLLILLLWQL